MDFFLGQLLALVTFFAFPALRYSFLKFNAKDEGNPELWYLPNYGFRLVIRNLPKKKCLSDIRYKVRMRTIIPASCGSSVATHHDKVLIEDSDFFLFPGNDQVVLSFDLKNDKNLELVHTDKLGKELSAMIVEKNSVIVADFTATVNNYFNFDVHISKRAEINCQQLMNAYSAIQKNNQEQQFLISRIRVVD